MGWTTWNKMYDGSLCRKVYSQLERERTPRGEDVYAFFALSFYARSYRRLRGKALITYNFGAGGGGRGEKMLTELTVICQVAPALDAIQRLIDRDGMASNMHIALAGNPNCGKTTLFNELTGSNGYVGNWPGVTVEKKEAAWKDDRGIILTDLPGIYSLSPYSPEEVVSRDYLVNDRPEAVIDLVDVTNLERNLYLTTQILEVGLPVVVGLNMPSSASRWASLATRDRMSSVRETTSPSIFAFEEALSISSTAPLVMRRVCPFVPRTSTLMAAIQLNV